jgi:putative peptide maturation dehydrogenase
VLRDLARKGLLVSDEDDELLTELARRDRRLCEEQWHPYAALYHFLARWRGVELEAAAEASPGAEEEAMRRFLARHGAPPAHFHRVDEPLGVRELPLVRRQDGLYRALASRATTRAFDRARPMSEAELSLVLYYVFGCQGMATVSPEIACLKKTSPSGGALHPIEVYLLLGNVAGVEPGLYHYRVEDHALELVQRLDEARSAELAREFTAGQGDLATAHALFLMTARFYRSFWKYRRHERAYGVVLMDAAHLSQTFYLVCADLGLGAFVTAAFNGGDVERRLGLDGYEEGAVAICGCGPPRARAHVEEAEFEPYVLPRGHI